MADVIEAILGIALVSLRVSGGLTTPIITLPFYGLTVSIRIEPS